MNEYLLQENGDKIILEDSSGSIILESVTRIGKILGLNNNTNIKIGSFISLFGLNKNTGIKTGTTINNIGKKNNTGIKPGTRL